MDEATEAVRRYAQMFYDILRDPSPTLNDMNKVAAQPQLALDLKSLQHPSSPQVKRPWIPRDRYSWPCRARQSSNPSGDPPTVVVAACVDRSANGGTESGEPWTGRRQVAQYRVVKTDYLPAPGWAVAKVLPPEGFEQPQPC